MKRKLQYILEFLKCNILKTLYFNFKMLPFKQALRMPIFLYGKFGLRSLDGSVEIRNFIYPGMIKIGVRDWYVATHVPQCIWTVNGKIIFHGPVRFLHGSYVLVAHGAELEIGSNGTVVGSDFKVMCFDRISIGNTVRIPWNVQIIDTSFHYIAFDDPGKEVKPLTKPVIIGDNVWIGNNTTISKGANIPSNMIVASNSLVNKDFSDEAPHSLIAGSPASVKSCGLYRIFDTQLEKQLDKQFHYDRTHL